MKINIRYNPKTFSKKTVSVIALASIVCITCFMGLSVSAADTVKPTLNLFIGGIDNPHNTAVTGTGATLTATASDDTGVAKIEFYINDVLYATDTESPFSTFWNTTAETMPDGPHVISAIAYDAAGNIAFDEFNETVFSAYSDSYSCSGSSLLICQDFSLSGGAANFVSSGGTWTMGGNNYSLSNPASASSGNGNLAIHNTLVSGDFTLNAQAQPSESGVGSNVDFSVVWGYQNASNYYYASFSKTNDSTLNGIFKVSSGVITELANFATTINDSFFYKVKVEKTGSSYRVYRNGVSIGTATDATFSSGRIGLGTRNNSATFFPTSLTSGTPAAYVAPPADTTPPVVTISQPSTGATVSGPVFIRWGHVDNAAGAGNAPAISIREVLVDGIPLTLSSTDFITWQSVSVPNGSHTITLNAYDAAGNLNSDSINVTVANETVAPTVSITSPTNGSTVVTNVDINATASDNVGVTKVDFHVGGIFKSSDTNAPYQYTWDSTSVSDGVYALQAKAFDAAGNTTNSVSISVTVANTQPAVSVYRLANYISQERLFTTSAPERDDAVANHPGWVSEGISFTSFAMQVPDTIPVYRLANYLTQERLFTTSAPERDDAVTNHAGWVYETVAFYTHPSAWPSGATVYRLANYISKERLFTTNAAERDNATANHPGWVYEGVAFKVP